MPESKKDSKLKRIDEDTTMRFYCEKCEIVFHFEDGTPLDDIKCPKCETYEIFVEVEMEDNDISSTD